MSTVSLVALACCRLPAVAQEIPPAGFELVLQQRLDKTCTEHNLPALWAGKFGLDGSSVICASGVRKLGEPDKAQPNDIVHLGSCTKAMTATVIGQLCTEGKLRLTSSLKEIFSDREELVGSNWGDVTVQELLQHRSGAVPNLDYQLCDRAFPESVIDARRLLLQKLTKKRRANDASFVYSNVGYIVLGHIIEEIEDKPWEEVIIERLFKPLKMESAAFGPVGLPDMMPIRTPVGPDGLAKRAWGHRESISLASAAEALFSGKPPRLEPLQIDNSRSLGPAGRAHMNLRDWSKFVIHFADPKGYQALNISEEIWRELMTPAVDTNDENRYAAGWILIDNPQLGNGRFHNGSNTTWYAYAFAVQSDRCCVLVATNVYNDAARRQCDAIARFMLQPK